MMDKRGVAEGELESVEPARPAEKAAHESAAKGGHPACGEDAVSRVAESLAAAIAGAAAKSRGGCKPPPV